MNMDVPRVFWEMLAESGLVPTTAIPAEITAPKKVVYENPYLCCGEVVLDYGNGCFLCRGCSKVVEDKFYVAELYPQERSSMNPQPVGMRNSMTIYRRRGYKPLTHFKEHLRRYMGGRFTAFPDGLVDQLKLEVDPLDRNAYELVRKVLKRKKLSKLYKEIFTLIYSMGGQPPQLNSEQYQACIRDFQWLMIRFFEQRDDMARHSMPSLYMLLDLILQKNDHEAYYHIPYLKDQRLMKNVLYMYQTLSKDQYEHHRGFS